LRTKYKLREKQHNLSPDYKKIAIDGNEFQQVNVSKLSQVFKIDNNWYNGNMGSSLKE